MLQLHSTSVGRKTIVHVRKRDLIGSLFSSETAAVEQESDRVQLHRLPVAVRIHKFLQLGAPLDPEKYFVPILKQQIIWSSLMFQHRKHLKLAAQRSFSVSINVGNYELYICT